MNGGRDVFFDTPWSVGVAPGDPDICYATDLFRTYRTLDGGKTWETVNSVRVGDDTWTTRGLDVTTNYGVHFDPFDARHLIISYTDIGAFQSRDGGASWSLGHQRGPLELAQHHLLGGLRSQGERAPVGRVQRNPRPAAPEDVSESRSQDVRGRRRRSPTTAADTWRPSNQGMPSTAVTHLVLDPASPAGSRTLVRLRLSDAVCTSPRTMENPGR